MSTSPQRGRAGRWLARLLIVAAAGSAGLTLAEIFELHGEPYYRRLEREVLAIGGRADAMAPEGSACFRPSTMLRAMFSR